MSVQATPGERSRRSSGRRWLLVIAALVLLGGSALVLAPASPGPPLDPDSPGPDGLMGVVELLETVGVDVDVSTSLPSDTSMKVFVPVDQMRDERREQWRDWVRDGGTLVVAGDQSPLHGFTPAGQAAGTGFGATEREPACELLPDVEVVSHRAWRGLEVPDEGTGCFPLDRPDVAWLVERPLGQGRVLALGSADPLTNAHLDEADHAALAASLLGPAPGERLRVVPRPEPGEAEVGLVALVAPSVWWGLLVAGLAVIAAAVWRGRRLGAPVAERLPPVVPSAELARSVAGLLQRTGDRQAAAQRLRRRARRDVQRHLGGAVADDSTALVEQLVGRAGVARADAELAVLDGPVADDPALLEVADAVQRVRRRLRRPPGG